MKGAYRLLGATRFPTRLSPRIAKVDKGFKYKQGDQFE